MAIFIRGTGNISIQDTLGKTDISAPVGYDNPYVRCLDPDFKEYISPIALRRMSPIIKRAISSSLVCVRESGIDCPDAIISGTGLGCIEDTEKFLSAMINNKEQFLQPTYFIQSTHNTISSQIAIQLKCHSYNNTYSHRGISFELALMDAFALFKTGNIKSALVAGHDEMTPNYFLQLKKINFWKNQVNNTLEIHKSNTPGSFAGEGNICFMLSDKPDNMNYAEIASIRLLYRMKNEETLFQLITDFLADNNLTPADIDVLMTGVSGDVNTDPTYFNLSNKLFPETLHAYYKNLCGEFFTAPAFGLWSAATCLKNKNVPDIQKLNDKNTGKIKNILLYNHYKNKNHSLILLK
jgi:3-oxoacyl-[acyl-carrier-protein] synthase II